MNIEDPSKKAIIFGYISQGLNIGYGVLILPFILMYLSSEEVAYWFILLSFIGLTFVFDFGFSPTISRTVTYVVSGADKIQQDGFSYIEGAKGTIDWSLFHDVVRAVTKLYLIISFVALLLMVSFGSLYIYKFLGKTEITFGYETWWIFLIGFVLNLYYLRYGSILAGMGRIYEAHLTNVITRSTWLVLSVIGLYIYQDLLVLPISYLLGVVFGRLYSFVIFRKLTKDKVNRVERDSERFGIKTLIPNSWRMGVVILGSFLINKATIFIGGLYLPVDEVASYALTLQVLAVLLGFSQVYFNSYIPMFSSLRIQSDKLKELKEKYYSILSKTLMIYVFISTVFIVFGAWGLSLIDSSVNLIATGLLLIVLLFGLLELNHTMAATFITTGNKVPFTLSAIISGLAIVLISIALLEFVSTALYILIFVQGTVQLMYNNWKWPLIVYRDLKVVG